MRIDLEDLRRHYAELSDEELEEIEAADLTEAARAVFQAEFARRLLPRPEADDLRGGHDTNSSNSISTSGRRPSGWRTRRAHAPSKVAQVIRPSRRQYKRV